MLHMETAAAQQGVSPVGAKKRQRVYEHWQGNERFFCSGYLVAGPNWKASIGTALLISAPAGVFLAFVAPYMGLHVHVIILVISCILPVLVVWFLMLTACRDPGIIPRQEPDQEYLSGLKPRTKEVYVNNQRVVIRYNDTCHFYQPPRAHHCSVNDNCIERFDHHCPWVGTTIGLRNYRTFLLFVYTSTVLCLYVFGVCVAMLFVKHDELVDDARERREETSGLWGKTLGKCVPALVLMGYTFLFFWFVGGLSVFHAYLVSTNQTTYENFRYNHDNRPNPYSRGCLSNCAEVWCSRVPPSKVQFRAYVNEFKAPTGQPYSPYLNGSGSMGPEGSAGQEHGAAGSTSGANGGMYGGDLGTSTQMSAPAGMMPPPHSQSAGGYGYAQSIGGAGSAAYDPAALQAGGQQYGMPQPYMHGQRYDSAGHVLHGEMRSATYSDAGAGWATGGGQLNEPPAQVKSQHAFTSQTAAVGATLGYGGNAGVSYSGQHAGMVPGAAPGMGMAPARGGGYAAGPYHHPQDNGGQVYYDDQYDNIGNDGYDDYDVADDGGGDHMHGRHGAPVGAEQVRPTLMR